MPAIVHCTAVALVDNDKVDVARRVCTYFERADEQKACMALALARKDFDASLAECDLIENPDEKAFCRALVIREVDVDRALEECEKIDPIKEQSRSDCRRFVLEKRK